MAEPRNDFKMFRVCKCLCGSVGLMFLLLTLSIFSFAPATAWCDDPAVAQTNAPETTASEPNTSKMIPIRRKEGRKDEFEMSLYGSALSKPYIIHFDTGSHTTSIPESYVNREKVIVIKKASDGAKDNWGHAADLVEGQLCVKSTDGKTEYRLEKFQFYVKKDDSGRFLMGAFPGAYPGREKTDSFPTALAKKYAEGKGFGIVSTGSGKDIKADWKTMESYLTLGPYEGMENELKWRSDIPNLRSGDGFSPEAIPGFSIGITFEDKKDKIRCDNLIATIDTGAPHLTMQLGSTNPQRTSTFESHFVNSELWKTWGGGAYEKHALGLKNANVSVYFQDDQGDAYSYSFPVGDDPDYGMPTALIAGDWLKSVPFALEMPNQPANRINLGNTIYYYCPVYYYDLKKKRIGIRFSTPGKATYESPLDGETLLPKGQKFRGGPKGEYYLSFQALDGNLVVKTIVGDIFKWGSYNNDKAPLAGSYGKVLADGNLAIYDKDQKEIWRTKATGGAKVSIDSSGKPIILDRDGKTVWTAK